MASYSRHSYGSVNGGPMPRIHPPALIRLVVLAVIALLAVCAAAQSPTAPQQPSSASQPSSSPLQVKTRVVTVDVVATNSHGVAIRDLKAEDFEISESGR